MSAWIELVTTRPEVFVHVVSMLGATVLGGWLLVGRKGRAAHRVGGWAWVGLMATAAVSSLFIRSTLPGLGGFGPIHLLTLMVMLQLPLGVFLARSHRIERHRRVMRGLHLGGCLAAGAFTLLPGRFLGQMLWA